MIGAIILTILSVIFTELSYSIRTDQKIDFRKWFEYPELIAFTGILFAAFYFVLDYLP